MPFDSQGNFTRVMSWQEDAANAVPIVASRHDDEDNNFAQGFNECYCRDGRAPATGNFKMGSYKITGLGNGTTDNDAVNKGQLDALNTTLTTAISTAISNFEQKIFPIGCFYPTKTNTNPNSILGFGTWTLLTSSVVSSIANTAAVIGNGKAIGFYDGTSTNPVVSDSNNYRGLYGVTYTLPANAGTTSTNWGGFANDKLLGLTTDSTKSGVIADTSSLATSKTMYIWERTA